MKRCPTCTEYKPLSDFGKSKSRCLLCKRQDNRAHRSAHPEEYKKQQREWRNKNPSKSREFQLKYKYGLTPVQYREMLEKQKGVCAICKEPETVHRKGKLKELAVDHNKVTGAVRQLLCQRCNQALGLLRDDPRIVLSVAEYVTRHNNPV